MNLYPRAITELFKIEVPIIQAPMLALLRLR
jgi:NAD(P)H-dependent flavin oxidoreductase YrpB (nitropropane dioxygenase family)